MLLHSHSSPEVPVMNLADISRGSAGHSDRDAGLGLSGHADRSHMTIDQ